jgi:hypothetical protein
MATIEREWNYKCDDDCEQSGCPGHKASFLFQTTSGVFCYKSTEDDEGTWFDGNELTAFLKVLEEVSSFRADMPRVVINPKKNS